MMTERENRRDEILQAAGDLFVQQGYAATSTKQIADAVGCTKAALYYHFQKGKDEIYQAAFKTHGPNLTDLLADCENAASLQDLILCFAGNANRLAPQLMARMRWVMAEFPNLTEAQRATMRHKKIELIRGLASLIEPFVASHQQAQQLAIITLAATMGYHHIFVQMGTVPLLESTTEDYMQSLAALIAAQTGTT